MHIEENERVCLVGRNGAGKSTLMRVLTKEQPLDDGTVIYEQDLIVARLQQDPPRDVEGTVFDFVAEGVAEQAQHIKAFHQISKLVESDPSDKNLSKMAELQEILDTQNLWLLDSRIADVIAHRNYRRMKNYPHCPAAGCVKRHSAVHWSAGRKCCFWMNRPTTWISKPSSGWKAS